MPASCLASTALPLATASITEVSPPSKLSVCLHAHGRSLTATKPCAPFHVVSLRGENPPLRADTLKGDRESEAHVFD